MPDPVDISHCIIGSKGERYDCVFLEHSDHIQYIYHKYFPEDKMVKGRVHLVLSITLDGTVAEVHVGKSTFTAEKFEAELLKYVSKMKFGMGLAQHTIRVLDFPLAE